MSSNRSKYTSSDRRSTAAMSIQTTPNLMIISRLAS
jgi:hypothetical protein